MLETQIVSAACKGGVQFCHPLTDEIAIHDPLHCALLIGDKRQR